jgi:homoserine acetyltransferase
MKEKSNLKMVSYRSVENQQEEDRRQAARRERNRFFFWLIFLYIIFGLTIIIYDVSARRVNEQVRSAVKERISFFLNGTDIKDYNMSNIFNDVHDLVMKSENNSTNSTIDLRGFYPT